MLDITHGGRDESVFLCFLTHAFHLASKSDTAVWQATNKSKLMEKDIGSLLSFEISFHQK